MILIWVWVHYPLIEREIESPQGGQKRNLRFHANKFMLDLQPALAFTSPSGIQESY